VQRRRKKKAIKERERASALRGRGKEGQRWP
jgi:hypothetical protein